MATIFNLIYAQINNILSFREMRGAGLKRLAVFQKVIIDLNIGM